jgi:hypothetical protein
VTGYFGEPQGDSRQGIGQHDRGSLLKTSPIPNASIIAFFKLCDDCFHRISVKFRAVFSLYEHREADGPDVFHHACKLGLEGIVSKRKNSRYKSGRSPDWVKSKNPDAPAVKRFAEEEWGR